MIQGELIFFFSDNHNQKDEGKVHFKEGNQRGGIIQFERLLPREEGLMVS